MDIRIAQINARRSATVAASLENLMIEEKIDVLCIQEPYVYKSKVRGYTSPGLRIVEPNKPPPWVAIVIQESAFDIFQLAHLETEHITCLELKTSAESFYFINVYCQYSIEIEPLLRRIEEIYLKLASKQVIITMDANAKSNAWYSGNTDDRGQKLEEMLITNGLNIINEPSCIFTFSSISGESNIDVSICTNNLVKRIKKWKVLSACTTSDHNVIRFDITAPKAVPKRVDKIQGYNLQKADWTKFKHEFAQKTTEQLINKIAEIKPNKAIKIFNKELDKVCKLSMPGRKRVNKSVPWWNEELNQLRKQANKAKKQLNRARRMNLDGIIETLKSSYRAKRNKLVKEIKRSKLETWKTFVVTEGNKDPWSISYKIVREKIKKPNLLGSIERLDGTITASWEESIDALLAKMVPKDEAVPENEKHKEIRELTNRYKNENLEQSITQAEIEHAIRRLKNNKAPGIDGIKTEIVKAAWRSSKEIFLSLYNNCFVNECFPTIWKEASLNIILKDQGRDPIKMGSYRPIALLPAMAKVYETIIVNRVETAYKEQNLDSPRQYGFKIGKSTEDALIKFRSIVRNTAEKYLVVLFVDIEGAFDNLWWPAIKMRIAKANCSSALTNIVRNYFKKRAMIVQTKHQRKCTYMQKGCPQGSIIGPYAWNWCMDQLLTEIDGNFHEEMVEVIAYADDIAYLIKGNSRRELEAISEKIDTIMSNWCLVNKLKTSPTKTVAILMKGSLSKSKLPNIKIGQQKIKYVNEVRYLGIIINRQLNFVSHVKTLRDKLASFILTIKRIAKAEWGIREKILRTLYKAAALPIITYGSSAWFDKCEHAVVKRHLLAAQRLSLLMHLRAYKLTATSALQVIGGIIPMDLEVIKFGIMGNVRRNSTIKWKNYTFHSTENSKNIDIKKEYNKIIDEIYTEWQTRWDEDSHGRHTYKFIKTVDFREERPWFNPGKTCIYLITGYGPINSTLHKRGVNISKECPFCKKEETAEHIMFDCLQYEKYRHEELKSNQCNWNKLINTKEEYAKFSKFARKAFTERDTHLQRNKPGPPPRG